MKHAATAIRLLFLALFLFLLANGNVMPWLALFAVSLIVALFFGRVYCGYVCPMNTLMGLSEWVSKKLKLQTAKTPGWLQNGYFPWITLGVSVAVMVLSKQLLHMNLPILPFWLVISGAVTLRYKPEVFHNLICPFGALQRTFGRFAKRTRKVDADACIGCGLCKKACPANAIVISKESRKAEINKTFCHQCTRCTVVCPRNAIHYVSDGGDSRGQRVT